MLFIRASLQQASGRTLRLRESAIDGDSMYFFLKALVRSLILPPAGPLILAVIGAVMIRRRSRLGWPLLVVGLTSMWLLSTSIVADELSRLAEHFPALDFSQPIDAQAIVILGGGRERMFAPEYGGPVADNVLLERLSYGAFLAQRTSLPVLVTGTLTEAMAMQTTLSRDFGVTTRWVDNHSHDTYENAHFTERLLHADGVTRIILVTSSTHLWRATQEFQSVGLAVVPAPSGMSAAGDWSPFGFIPGPSALMRSNAAIYELIGEQVRRMLAASGLREKYDKKALGP
jgi:uncharacterized SAM-binding protein YcdF (DUF218 family)